jgi:hypothetical protein
MELVLPVPIKGSPAVLMTIKANVQVRGHHIGTALMGLGCVVCYSHPD